MIIGFAIMGALGSDSYSDHSRYSDYSSRRRKTSSSRYSDAAYRKKKRIEEKDKEIENALKDLEDYKMNHVNEFLDDEVLIGTNAQSVADIKLDKAAKKKINKMIKDKVKEESKQYKKELREIDKLISIIENKLGNEEE
ncbi:MAG: hypothetical protein E7265_02855 [Lachnospiraceae bacterium]|nr:hypothetical protein [Lachnospiraceae bacterium]